MDIVKSENIDENNSAQLSKYAESVKILSSTKTVLVNIKLDHEAIKGLLNNSEDFATKIETIKNAGNLLFYINQNSFWF